MEDKKELNENIEIKKTEEKKPSKKQNKNSKETHEKKEKKKKKKEKYPKGFFAWMFLLFVVVASLVAYNYNVLFENKEIVAEVNGEKIFMDDLDAQFERMPELYKPFMTKESLLERIINFVVLRQYAEESGIEVTNQEVDSVVKYLSYYLTEEEFNQEINAYSGLKRFKSELKETMLVQKYVSENVVEFMSSEEELLDMYEQYSEILNQEYVRASHIIICHEESADCLSELSKEEAYNLIEEIKEKTSKEDFSNLAKNFSSDGSAENGGDLGWFTRGEMVPEFEEVVFSLKEKEISNIVETEFGFHIIKLISKKEPIVTSFEDIKPFIKFTVFNQIQQVSNNAFIEFALSEREKADIEIFLELSEGFIVEDVQLIENENTIEIELNEEITIEEEKCFSIDEKIIIYYMKDNERSNELIEITKEFDSILYIERSEDISFIETCIDDFKRTIVPQIICSTNNNINLGALNIEEFNNFYSNC
jgi:parvulin-like peptidyl-prolyl isomerase